MTKSKSPGVSRIGADWCFVLAVLLTALTARFASGQTVLFVDDDAASGGDGLTWSTAFDDIQPALDAITATVAEIRVAQGTYKPSLQSNPAEPRSVTFALPNGVALRGGFAGVGAPDPDHRDFVAHETVLTGDLNGDDGADFANNGENAIHVCTGIGVAPSTILEGFTVTAGNANLPSEITVATNLGGGLFCRAGSPTIISCRYVGNSAEYGGAVYCRENSNTSLAHCTFERNEASNSAPAVRYRDVQTISITDCDFIQNESPLAAIGIQGAPSLQIRRCKLLENIGGGMNLNVAGLQMSDCLIAGNRADVGGGATISNGTSGRIERCVIRDNTSTYAAGGMTIAGFFDVVDCEFLRNSCEQLGGGVMALRSSTFVNCLFGGNSAGLGGGIYNATDIVTTNCTFSGNEGSAILTFVPEGSTASVSGANCIFWGNSPGELTDEPTSPAPATVILHHCLIAGGWYGTGSNNLDADPLFIQPGCNDYRLAHGSPAIDAGNNSLLPPGIRTDLAGQQRILNGIVDLGAYEGGHDVPPPAACFDDLDVGEFIRLVPLGGVHDPVIKPSIGVRNLTGTIDEWVNATQFDEPPPPALAGTDELSSIVRLETSLLDGHHFSTPTISFEASDLNGVDATTVDLVYYHEQSHRWRRAALGNTVNSPGHGSPLGDRIVMVGTDANYGLGQGVDPGDHGVFWNPELQRGFVWARVDFASDFAVAVVPLCIADCASPANLNVDMADLMLVVNAWQSTGPGLPADLNHDEIVDMSDILTVVAAWGRCP